MERLRTARQLCTANDQCETSFIAESALQRLTAANQRTMEGDSEEEEQVHLRRPVFAYSSSYTTGDSAYFKNKVDKRHGTTQHAKRIYWRARPRCDITSMPARTLIRLLRSGTVCGQRIARIRFGLNGR